MLRNYVLIAIRSLTKQKVYTAINIAGLSTGIAASVLIMLFIMDELSYDNFHDKSDRIYKIGLERKYPNHVTNYAVIPHSFADVMVKDFPEVEQTVKMGGPINDVQVAYEETSADRKQFEEDFVMAADSNFFQVFSIKLIKGEPTKVLANINSIVLTESTARRYFGQEDPVGKTLKMFQQDFVVSGICEDVPEQSHMKFDFLIKWNDGNQAQENFITFSAHVYVLMRPGTSPATLESKFPAMVDHYAAAQIERDLGKSWIDYKKQGNGYRYFLQPLQSIHLDPLNIESKIKPGGNKIYVYFLMGIAILTILIACINFMNLATARSAERAKEVGVRKTMGSETRQLVAQFLTESVMLALIATIIAVALMYAVLPGYNNLVSKTLHIPIELWFISVLVAGALFIGFLAGFYPAFVLSAYNPVVVMKGKFTGHSKGAWLRNGLVVFQFFISIVLITGTIVVNEQMLFMQSKSLGYDKEQILIIEQANVLDQNFKTFVDAVEDMPGVQHAGSTFSMMGRNEFFGAQFQTEGSSEILTTKATAVDDGLAETIGLQFVQGRGFSKETNDSLSIVLNETAAKTLGIDDPIGKKISLVQRTAQGVENIPYTIIGIVRDFNYQSLRDPITPLAIQSIESFGGVGAYVFVRAEGDGLNQTIDNLKVKWESFVNDVPFKYSFLDQNLHALYENEERSGKIFATFSSLAIIIACVGLFGLAAYTANLRTKEIGVRKVLGASVFGVVLLLSWDFTKLVLMALALATPVSWFLMNEWLENFAFRIEPGPLTFLFAGAAAMAIAWLTVCYQSLKAAMANPVKSLRSE